MNLEDLTQTLSGLVGQRLANDLVQSFAELRQDVRTGTLGRSGAGKFVEGFVQALQHIEGGSPTKGVAPRVDDFLRGLESRASTLDDGLRICAARVARSMYALRNKRSIAHTGDVDTNTADLRYLYAAAQWILAELVRHCAGISMEAAGKLVAEIQVPVTPLVEVHRNRRLVLARLTTQEELLVLLHSVYPERRTIAYLIDSVDRRDESTVRKAARKLWEERLIEGTGREGFYLTLMGYREAEKVISRTG